MEKAYINCTTYYLPDKKLSNEELLEKFPDWSVDKVASKIGINERHISASDEFCSDMAIKVSEKLFAEYNIDRSTIDFVLLCTQSPDYSLPTTACIIQNKLAIPTSAGAIDINQGCSGYIYGLALAKGLIAAGISKNILFITSETYTKLLSEDDKSNRTIFGDAASATLITTQGKLEINDFVLGSDGKGWNNLIVNNGAKKNYERLHKSNNEEEKVDDDFLYMNGTEIFNFTLEMVPKLVTQTIEKNNLAIENVDYFIFHQANKYMLNHLRKKIGIDESKFKYFMESCGNTVSSTIPIVIYEFLAKENIEACSKILLAGFGVGYSWGGCMLTYNNE